MTVVNFDHCESSRRLVLTLSIMRRIVIGPRHETRPLIGPPYSLFQSQGGLWLALSMRHGLWLVRWRRFTGRRVTGGILFNNARDALQRGGPWRSVHHLAPTSSCQLLLLLLLLLSFFCPSEKAESLATLLLVLQPLLPVVVVGADGVHQLQTVSESCSKTEQF